MSRTLEWILSGIVGGIAYWVVSTRVIPLLADWLHGRSRQLAGVWKARIRNVSSDGTERESSEIVIVKQWGGLIWGRTEIGSEPFHSDLGLGNKFRGRVRGSVFVATFESRAKRTPYAGVISGKLSSEKEAQAIAVGRFSEGEPLVAHYDFERVR